VTEIVCWELGQEIYVSCDSLQRHVLILTSSLDYNFRL